jgi:hypothetical protein
MNLLGSSREAEMHAPGSSSMLCRITTGACFPAHESRLIPGVTQGNIAR